MDGAYSSERQQLYNALKPENSFPASDDVSLPYSCICLVGQTPRDYIIDKTPMHLISKVMLEEIVFDTWFDGHTVLMGNAYRNAVVILQMGAFAITGGER
ncbi:hypothetical protein BGZ92_001732 [Podila epicladia]|nr:hypothetical protein BGZ92_001732 [Podila epicladia]